MLPASSQPYSAPAAFLDGAWQSFDLSVQLFSLASITECLLSAFWRSHPQVSHATTYSLTHSSWHPLQSHCSLLNRSFLNYLSPDAFFGPQKLCPKIYWPWLSSICFEFFDPGQRYCQVWVAVAARISLKFI